MQRYRMNNRPIDQFCENRNWPRRSHATSSIVILPAMSPSVTAPFLTGGDNWFTAESPAGDGQRRVL
jgi:hypothetical protein